MVLKEEKEYETAIARWSNATSLEIQRVDRWGGREEASMIDFLSNSKEMITLPWQQSHSCSFEGFWSWTKSWNFFQGFLRSTLVGQETKLL